MNTVGSMKALHTFHRYSGALLRAAKKQAGALPFTVSQRHYVEPGNYIQVEEDSAHKEIAILRMNRKPFNGFNKDFLDEFKTRLANLENSDTCRGVIVTSANPGIFSAGLDITELYQRSDDHLGALWQSLQEFCMALYGTRLVTLAAINGHCTAGGCLMSLSCDYRLMAEGKYGIGFSTSRLGVITPFWVHELMSKSCGNRMAEMSFQLGSLYTPEEALAIGLVDELAGQHEIMNSARDQMLRWLKIPDHARVMTKRMIRTPLIEKVRHQHKEEITYYTDFLQRDSVQQAIGMFMENLKRKK